MSSSWDYKALAAAGEEVISTREAYRSACSGLWRAALAARPQLGQIQVTIGWTDAGAADWVADWLAEPIEPGDWPGWLDDVLRRLRGAAEGFNA